MRCELVLKSGKIALFKSKIGHGLLWDLWLGEKKKRLSTESKRIPSPDLENVPQRNNEKNCRVFTSRHILNSFFFFFFSQAFDAFIYIFFALEMVVKMVALGIFGRRCYLGDTWNRLDFFIVMAG